MRAALIVTLVFVPCFAAAQGPSQTDTVARSATESAALAAVVRMFEGMRTADSAMVRSVFAPDARFASYDTRATPPKIAYEPVDGWITAIANSNRRWEERIYDVQVRVDGNIAQVWAPYTFYLDGNKRHCGVNAIDMIHDGAGWKVTQFSDTRRRENCP